jgi:hypothetical protein
MLVFWAERLIFLSVPKTGTTALAAALGPRAGAVFRSPTNLKHMALAPMQRQLMPIFTRMGGAGLETLAVVRHPVSWLSSWYRYRQREGLPNPQNSTQGISFDEFVTAWCSDRPPAFATVGQQSRFLAPAPAGAPVTHLYRYEAQDRLLAFLEGRLGRLPAIPRLNVSPEGDTPLSPAVEARLRDWAAADFALWDAATH